MCGFIIWRFYVRKTVKWRLDYIIYINRTESDKKLICGESNGDSNHGIMAPKIVFFYSRALLGTRDVADKLIVFLKSAEKSAWTK